MSATDPTDRAFKQYADLERQALKWRAERDKAIAEGDALATRCNTAEREGDAARDRIERALAVLRDEGWSANRVRHTAVKILTEGQERFGWTINHLLECEEALRTVESAAAEAIAERDAARKQIERALFILRASSLSGQQARARALTILTEGQET